MKIVNNVNKKGGEDSELKDEGKEYVKRLKKELVLMMGKKRALHKLPLTGGLTRLEIFALQQIWEAMNESPGQKGVHVSVLAKRMDIMLSSASRTLNTLEEKGLIYREIDSKSRRNICVSLTKEGEGARERCVNTMSRLTERVIERMGAEDMERLLELWRRFSDLIEEEAGLMEEKKE